MRVRYQCKQNCLSRPCRFLPVHPLVGKEKLVVRLSFTNQCYIHTDTRYRSWVLILGMSGLIVLFWFVAEGEGLRYFVSISPLRVW